jgi:heme/copper-type cytochrome/quinol oxidase subunit 3
MGRVIPFRSPRVHHEERAASLGMALFLGSCTMLFAPLFAAYLRTRGASWPDAAPGSSPALTVLGTAGVATACVALHAGLSALRLGQTPLLVPRLGGALLGALVVLGAEAAECARLADAAHGAPLPALFVGITALHAAFVLVALLGLGWLLGRALRGAYVPARHLPVRLWAMYWNFVAALWAAAVVVIHRP